MGHCPTCGLTLCSTAQAAQTLGVTDSRVRALVAPRQARLPAARVGWGWIVPAPGLAEFRPQPNGVRLPGAAECRQGRRTPTCPDCGERFLDVRRAAQVLGISTSGVYAILARYPHRIQAFQVGGRWFIPQSGLEAYGDRNNGGAAKHQEVAPVPVEIPVEVEPAPCRCGAYPFPHRPGGGKCANGMKPRRRCSTSSSA